MIKKKIFPKTAIISQSNKNGLKKFANQIKNLGIDIFSPAFFVKLSESPEEP